MSYPAIFKRNTSIYFDLFRFINFTDLQHSLRLSILVRLYGTRINVHLYFFFSERVLSIRVFRHRFNQTVEREDGHRLLAECPFIKNVFTHYGFNA